MEKKCVICNKIFSKPKTKSKKEWLKRVVCSRDCSNKHQSNVMKKLYDTGILHSWNKGQKNLELKKLWKTEKFRKKMKKRMSGEKSPSWKKNPTHSSTYYQRARKHKKEFCEICDRKNIRLEVHHKDGNIKNNTLENLMTLCNHCHKILDQRASRRDRDNNGRFLPNS